MIDVVSIDHQIHRCILSSENVGSMAADKCLYVTKACHHEKGALTGNNCLVALALTAFLKIRHLWLRSRADIDDRQTTNKQTWIVVIKTKGFSDIASGWKHCPKLGSNGTLEGECMHFNWHESGQGVGTLDKGYKLRRIILLQASVPIRRVTCLLLPVILKISNIQKSSEKCVVSTQLSNI